jgi:hypothetical protein
MAAPSLSMAETREALILAHMPQVTRLARRQLRHARKSTSRDPIFVRNYSRSRILSGHSQRRRVGPVVSTIRFAANVLRLAVTILPRQSCYCKTFAVDSHREY